MTSWVPIQTALINWVKTATGLDAAHVILGEQNGLAPVPGPWVTVSLWDTESRGIDAIYQDNENLIDRTVDHTAMGLRILTAVFRAYSPNSSGDATARALLALVQLYSAFARDDLNAVGLGLLDQGRVQALPKVVNAGWESQAILEVPMCVIQTLTVVVPYIETVNGEGTFENPGSSDVVIDFTLVDT